MTDLTNLLGKLERATGADREIDEALMALAYTRDERHIGAEEDSGPHGEWVRVKDRVWVDPKTDKWVSTAALSFTASVDAALALVERLRPELVIKATKLGDGSGHWQITEAWFGDTEVVDDMAPMDPRPGALAILIALIKSLLEEQHGH